MPIKHKYILPLLFITGLSHSVHLSQNGMGEVLILPYYTVNNGFDTLLTITNTKNQAKAIRVRFREAANNRSVFEFNLYLGKKDMWTGGLIKSNTGYTEIISFDKSCTIPSFLNNTLSFTNENYTGDMPDEYGDTINRLNEGFIEIIEMGEIVGDSAQALEITQDSEADCSTIENAWLTNGYWMNDASTDMLPLSGGLIADATLINVAKGMTISEKATAISDFSDEILHYNVNNNSPNLSSGKTTSTVIDDKGYKHELQWQTGFEALSSVITESRIYNEYTTQDEIGAKTDWVLTMPTKQYYTDPLYAENLNIAPFNDNFMSDLGLACQDIIGSAYSRASEQSVFNLPPGPVDPPPPPQPDSFYENGICWSTNTVSFIHEPNHIDIFAQTNNVFIDNQANHIGIFASNYTTMNGFYGASVLASDFDNGMAHIELPQSTSRNTNSLENSVEVIGLPIIGFSVQQYVNGNLGNDVLANYAGYFNHKYETKIMNPDLNTENFAPMQLSEDGVGQALLYPYYSVRNSMNTLFTVVNATDDAKALRVLFKDGNSSFETFSFNIYLAAHDSWTGALLPHIIQDGDFVGAELYEGSNGVKLFTFDNTCTLPNNISGRVFRMYEIGVDPEDIDIERTQEGMLQVIDMGTLTGDSALAVSFNDGNPNDCGYLLDDNQLFLNPLLTVENPTGKGGIYGSVSLIDVGQGIDMSYDAIAINNFSNESIHQISGSFEPNLSSAQNRTLIETESGLIQTTWDNGVDAVSALLMHENIINDYNVETPIRAQTDLVWSFPTRSFYQDSSDFSDTLFFNNRFALDAFNREQSIGMLNSDIIFPNGTGYEIGSYDHDINVSSLSNDIDSSDTIFDSANRLNDGVDYCTTVSFPCASVDPGFRYMPFSNGWFDINNTTRATPTSGPLDVNFGYLTGVGENDETHILYGIPSIGFVAQQYKNGTLNGGNTLANYGLIKMNKYSKPRLEIIE